MAWALGKIPDKRAIQPLYDLDKKLQAIRDPDNVTLKKLKEAVFWSIKQCDTWDQYQLREGGEPVWSSSCSRNARDLNVLVQRPVHP